MTQFLSHLPVRKLRSREGHEMPELTQHEMKSQDGSPGLLTPGSVLSPMQVACARFSRVLSPFSGVELIGVAHMHPILWLNLLPEMCWAQRRVPQGTRRPSAWAGVAEGPWVKRGQQGKAKGPGYSSQGKSDRFLPPPLLPKCPSQHTGQRGPLTHSDTGVLKMGSVLSLGDLKRQR